MKDNKAAETYISVLLARNGPLIIFQGFYKNALYVSRSEIPRFIRDPEHTPLLVIPPFAALALNCYLALEHVDAIELKHDIVVSEDYTLTMRSKQEQSIRYYSNHEMLHGARTLRASDVQVVITPRMTATVDTSELEPRLSVVTEFPVTEKPDYPRRFAHDVRLLSESVARAVAHLYPTLRYEN
jgi:hypothetical protein